MLVVAIGTIVAVLDGSIANTALPTIARELHTSPDASVWVVNGFQVAVTMTLVSFASLGDSRGQSNVYRLGIVAFTLGSLLCALSRTLPLLVASRMLQGCGAAGLMAVGPALYRQIYPRRLLGRALGLSAVIVATSAAAGPTVGGALLAVAPWPWLFAVNVPLGIIAFALAARGALPETRGTRAPFDVPSALLSACAFGVAIHALDGFRRRDGVAIAIFEAALVAGAATAFVLRQRRLVPPFLAIDLFAAPAFALASLTAGATYVAQGLAFVALPFFFQSALGRTPLESGMLLTSWPLCVAVVAPIAGRLSDRYPAGILSTVGLGVMAAGLALYAALPAHPTTVDILLRGALCGIGFGFFQAPNNRELMGSAPRDKLGSAAGVLASVRLLGQSAGAALVAVFFGAAGAAVMAPSHADIARAATPAALWTACGAAAIAAVVSGARNFAARNAAAPASATTR